MKGIPRTSKATRTSRTRTARHGSTTPTGLWTKNLFTERSQRFFGNAFVKFTTKFGTDNHNRDVKYQLGDDAYTTNYSEIYGYGSTMADTGDAIEYHYSINELNSLLTASLPLGHQQGLGIRRPDR